MAVAYDSTGNLFFADARRHQVFELTLAGTWSVVAGTGEQGFGGDGGPATAALLNGPRGLAVAADGTLYIADTGNQRVRVVKNGVISTTAGSGVRGFSGDGVALQAALRDPAGLATDGSGNLLVCDTGNQRVRRISGGSIVTVAGNGVQGYSGDGAAATTAELDTPLGVAVAASGTVLIADTHNQRVRALSTGGIITTFAGTGVRGFAGDGGQAVAAALDLPYGVAVGNDGSVLIADAGNQRIRSVSTQGVISTVAGSGMQGMAADATSGVAAVLNNPRAVSVQLQGQPVLADASNGLVRELGSDNALYTLALLTAPRGSIVTLNTATPVIYGQAVANVGVAGSAATPQGSVTLRDNGSALGSAKLSSGSTNFSLSQLGAGGHVLTATYAGDGLNGSASSPATTVAITPAPAVAVANAATMMYGGALPALTGTLSGILPQDASNVSAVFSSVAGSLSPVGTYPITATLSGQESGNYALSMGASSGSLVISPAATTSTLSTGSQTYVGLPILLSANVVSTTSGSPSGSVDFLEGATVLNSAPLLNGAASASVLSPAQGTHTYSARYNGDKDFLPSLSASATAVVAAMPDFSVTAAPLSESVQGGSAAVFTVNAAPQNGPFTGAITFNVSGLPQGAVATFSPTAVVPGSAGASVTLSVQTVARSGALRGTQRVPLVAALCALALLFWRPPSRRRYWLPFVTSGMAVLALLTLGCGTRTTGSSSNGGQTYTLTISGTGTNLSGVVVSHSATATLIVL